MFCGLSLKIFCRILNLFFINLFFILLSVLLLCGCSKSFQATKNTNVNATSHLNTKLNVNPKSNLSASKVNIELGLKYLTAKMFKRAKLKLYKAKSLAPGLPQVHSALAYYYENVNEYELALAHHKKALQLVKNYSNNKNLSNNNSRKKVSNANTNYSTAVLHNYASFLCYHRKFDEGLSFFAKALNNKAYVNIGLVYANAGKCAFEAKKLTLAKSYLKKAIQHNQNDIQSIALLNDVNLILNIGNKHLSK